MFIIFCAYMLGKITEVRYCSNRLFGAGIGLIMYFGFWSLRNCLVIAIAWHQKEPAKHAMFQRMGWTLVDYILLTGFLIWTGFVIFGEEARFCAAHVQEI